MTDNSIQTKRLEIALEQYERLIFSICYRMVGDYFDAQDVTQETFLTYYKVLERFNGQNEKAFLTKIATNKCLDFLKQKRRKEMPSEDEVLESRAGTVSSPEERFLDEEIKGELQQACRDLKPPYGQVAYEFYCCDHTAREIADMRGREAENRADADRQGEENASEEIETPDSRIMKGGALWHILRKNRSENIIGMN